MGRGHLQVLRRRRKAKSACRQAGKDPAASDAAGFFIRENTQGVF